MTDIRLEGLQKPIDVAEYLFRRLHEIGVRSVHGVPGDYNLVALDYIPGCNLKWVGSVNELNAGKATSKLNSLHLLADQVSEQRMLPMGMHASRRSRPFSPPLVLASSPLSMASREPSLR